MKPIQQLIEQKDFLDSLPSASRRYAAAWMAGQDLSLFVPCSTFARQAKILLQHGIDIAKPCDVTKSGLVRFLTVSEVAEYLKISERRVRDLLHRGCIPGFKDKGGSWCIRAPFTIKPGIRDRDLNSFPVLSLPSAY